MSILRQVPKLTAYEEDELRAFYASWGMSAATIERAIEARRNPPAEEPSPLPPHKPGKRAAA
jgi:hypothetical protein